MQNFSLNVKQSATVKPVEESSKNALNTHQNSPNTQENASAQNSFKSLLNKQVQAKRAQENNASAKVVQKPVAKNNENKQANTVEKNVESNGEAAKVTVEDLAKDEALKLPKTRLEEILAVEEKIKELVSNETDVAALKEKISDDAAMLAAIMQELNSAPTQVMVDPASVKLNAQGVNQTNISEEGEHSSLISSSDQRTSKTGLSDQLGQQLLDQAKLDQSKVDQFRLNQPLQNGLSNAAELKVPRDTFEKSAEMLADKSKQDALPANDLKQMPLEAQMLKNASEGQELLSESTLKNTEAKELTTINSIQNFQQANSSMLNSANAAAQLASSNQILTPFGKSGWDQAINQKVMWMVGAGEQTATLTLNPPDLGPLQVVVSVNNDQADASFYSDNADVRQALQDGLEHLREKMEESGIQLGQANINAGQQSQQSFQEATQQQGSGQAKSTIASNQLNPVTPMIQRESVGLVDTFA